MDFLKRMLKRARESDIGSRDQYYFESSALYTVKAMVSVWADDYHRGEPLKGHDRVRWMKKCYTRIQELDEMFKDDEKIRKEEK
jgi:hypothetical protein